MNMQRLVLIKKSSKPNAPEVSFNGNECAFSSDQPGEFSYSVSSSFGKILLQGRFSKECTVDLSDLETKDKYTLNIFNLDYQFNYIFQVVKDELGVG